MLTENIKITIASIAFAALLFVYPNSVSADDTVAHCDSTWQDILPEGQDWREQQNYLDCLANLPGGAVTGGVGVDCNADAAGSFDECFSGGLDTYGTGENPITVNLLRIISFLSIGIGILVTINVVMSGILWVTSGGDPQRKAKALSRIWNSAIALIIFIAGWTLINWLVPGGVLNSSVGTSDSAQSAPVNTTS